MVQTHLSRRITMALWVIVCLGLAPQVSFARSLPWYLQANVQPTAPASIKTEPIEPGVHPVVVAVIDSGVLPNHPALKGVLLPGHDMIAGARNLRGGRSGDFSPDAVEATCGRNIISSSFHTHGTEVASIVAGNGHLDMWGVNPKARILPIRVFGACGMVAEDMVDAIRWAAGLPVSGLSTNPNPARIINMSIAGGSTECRPALQGAIDAANQQGTFVVAAAGNNFQRPLVEPANCRGVISVGALSAQNEIEKYSALDPRTSIYTVGGGPPLRNNTPWQENKLRVATVDIGLIGSERLVVLDKAVGTSFAAPLVSGFLSLWLSHSPHVKPADWKLYAKDFVRSVPQLSKCPDCQPMGLVAQEKRIRETP
jgi:serine protease